MIFLKISTQEIMFDADIRKMYPHTSFPPVLTDEVVQPLGIASVIDVDPPENTETEKVIQDGFVQVDGHWQPNWVFVDRFPSITLDDGTVLSAEQHKQMIDNLQQEGATNGAITNSQ